MIISALLLAPVLAPMLISALASQTLIYPRADLRVAPRPLSMGLSTTARRARFASRSLSMSGAKGGAATKFIVVTGGVISGIGKGVTASSIGVCMKMLGARVTAVKIDPYLNVDAGTMSPLDLTMLTMLHYAAQP